MYLVVLHEQNYGEIVRRNSYSSDPLLGEYAIASGGYVDEKVNLLEGYPRLGEIKGAAIVFWSSDLVIEKDGSRDSIRLSGSVPIRLPVFAR